MCKKIFIAFILVFISILGISQTAKFTVNGNTVNSNDIIDICEKSTVVFRNSLGSPTSYGHSWVILGTNYSTTVSYTHLFNTVGIFKIFHYYGSGGSNFVDSVNIRVNNVYPKAIATFSPSTLECANSNFTFTGSNSTGNGLKYHWDMEDGTSYLSANASHLFNKAVGSSSINQNYDVSLIVTNDVGCTNKINLPVTVKRLPDASIATLDGNSTTFPKESGITTFRDCSNQESKEFEFKNNSTTINDNAKYEIDWGDGSPKVTMNTWSSSNNIKHTFKRGISKIRLTVTNNVGCASTKEYNVFVGSNPAAVFGIDGNTTGLCAPSDVKFKISNYQNNGTGTLYTFIVSDGSKNVVMQHPPKDEVVHQFLKSSCGYTVISGGNTTNNSFYSTLIAENPCDQTVATISPIVISEKPNPIIQAPNNVCINSEVEISHTKAYGQIVNSSSCSENGKQVWVVSPSTGFVPLSGSNLGSLNGNELSSTNWTNGSVGINGRFTQTGTYTFKLYIGNDLCGVSIAEKVICVQVPPTSEFTLDKNSICTNNNVKTTNTSKKGACTNNTYNWTVQYQDAENCGGSAGYSFANGTSAASENPEFTFTTPGKYTITLRTTTSSLGCTPITSFKEVFVKAPPKVTVPNLSGVCAGNAITPTATVVNCYSTTTPTYSWTFAGGVPATSTVLSPGNIMYNTNGSFNIKLEVTNECGTNTIDRPVVISAKPTADAGLDKETCSGEPITIGSSRVTGISYEWTPGTGLSSTTVANPTLTAVYNGTDEFTTLKYTVKAYTSTNCFSTDEVAIKVKKTPSLALSAINTNLCTGDNTTITAFGADTYVWSPITGLNAGTGNEVIASPTATTTYSVTGIGANGCKDTKQITINVTKTVSANAGKDELICSGKTVKIGTAETAGMNYSWSPVLGLTNAKIAQPTVNYKYTGSDNDTTIIYTLTVSAGVNCSSTDIVEVKILRSPDVKVTPVTMDICVGGSVELIASGADTYTWDPSSGLSDSKGEKVTATPNKNTTYTVTGTLSNTCSATSTATIAVKTLPNIFAGNDTIVCRNTSLVQLKGTPVGGLWSGHPALASNGTFDASKFELGEYIVTYTYKMNGCEESDDLKITVQNPLSVSAGGNKSYCASSTPVSLVGNPAGGRWEGSIVTTNGSLNISIPGIYQLVYKVGTGACINTDNIEVTVGNAILNNSIAASHGVCYDSLAKNLVGGLATAGSYAVTYQWQSSINKTTWNDIVTNGNDKDLILGNVTTTTYYRRLAKTSLCPTPNISNVVEVLIYPNAKAEMNPVRLMGCAPFNITPSTVNLVPHADKNDKYLWFLNGAQIAEGIRISNAVIEKSNTKAELKLVTISKFGCVNDTVRFIFETYDIAEPSFTSNVSIGCGPLDVTFTNTTPNADKYTFEWDFGNGLTSKGANPGTISFPVNPNFGDTVYKVKVRTFNECKTETLEKNITVRTVPRPLFTPDIVEGCSPMLVKFNNTSYGSNATYEWDFGDGSPRVPADGAMYSHTYHAGARTTYYATLYAKNDCGTNKLTYAIVVNPNTVKLDFALNGNQKNICLPESILFINNTFGANLFRWNFGDGTPEITTTKGIDSVFHSYKTPGEYIVTLFATNGCSDTTTTESITVSQSPKVDFSVIDALCLGKNIGLTNLSDIGLSYSWDFGDGSTSSQTNPQKSYSQKGEYTIKLTGSHTFSNGFNCASTIEKVVKVTDTLSGSFTATPISGCYPLEVSFANQTTPSAKTVWDFGDNSTGNGDNVAHTFRKQGTYTVTMVATDAGGCNFKDVKTINVFGPNGELKYTSGYHCITNAVSFEAISNNSQFYLFDFGNGVTQLSQQANINYQYPNPGTYTPSVTFINNGCSSKVVGLAPIMVDKINVGFTYSINQICNLTTLQFTDTTKSYFNKASFAWDFGNGQTSVNQNTATSYTNSGTYNVKLTVTSESKCVVSFNVNIPVVVEHYPVANFEVQTPVCIFSNMQFTSLAQSQTPISNHIWQFGNGLNSTLENPIVVYNALGNYTVRYIVITNFGCADTLDKQVTAQPRPTVNASNDIRICLGQQTTLNATGALSYVWSPNNNLSCTDCNSTIASPAFTTKYFVSGINQFGCSNVDSVVVEVVQPVKITVTPNDTLCIGESSQLFATGAVTYKWLPAVGLDATNIPNPIATPNTTVRYTVVGYDGYNCFTDTTYTTIAVGQYPHVEIGNGDTIIAGTFIQFNPVVTNGPIKNYTWYPTTYLSNSQILNPSANINNTIRYILDVENIYGCKGSDTVSYVVLCSNEQQLYMANAFSPDGDGINDLFMVQGKGIMVKSFRVYNRWGQLVYDGGSNFEPNARHKGWDGRVAGKAPIQDVYVYTVEVQCTAGGGVYSQKGNVSLIMAR